MAKVPIEISARHIHLSLKDLEKLFGRNYKLKKKKDLSQPGEFAAEETVSVQNGKRKIDKVRIIWPTREKTQLEISTTDAFALDLDAPTRSSGDLKGSPGILLISPKGRVRIKEGVIVPWRHIHSGLKEAKKYGLKSGQMVSVKAGEEREVIFKKVRVRIGENYNFCMHLDIDEGNAAGIKYKDKGEIICS